MNTVGASSYKAHAVAVSQAKASEAFELYKKGISREEIAKQLNVSVSSVGNYIRNTLKALAKVNSTDIAIIRAEIKERLLYIASESIKAWEKSKEFTTKKNKVSKKTGGKDAGEEVSQEIEVGHGEVKFLNLAKETVDSLSTLYGAAPKDSSSSGTGTISISQAGSGEVVIKTAWGIQQHPVDAEAEVVNVTPEVKEIEYNADS